MKSNKVPLAAGRPFLLAILLEVEKIAIYDNLDDFNTRRIRLLAEELGGMLPHLLTEFTGCFWAESDEQMYYLHLELNARVDLDTRDALLSVSTTGKNASAVGITGKIRAAAQTLSLYSNAPGMPTVFACDFAPDIHFAPAGRYEQMWSLQEYRESVRAGNNEDAWDELEKSIVAQVADDVTVGIKGKKIEIIVTKQLDPQRSHPINIGGLL